MMQLQQGFATGEMGAAVRGQFGLHDSNSKPLMSVLGHSRLCGASWRSSHVRNAPLATVGLKKEACREGPLADLTCGGLASEGLRTITKSR